MSSAASAAPRHAYVDDLFVPLYRRPRELARVPIALGGPRIGVIHNGRARHNVGRHRPRIIPGCDQVMPRTHDELNDVLADFVANGVDVLAIDGGDGTVRDILSAMARHFPDFRPHIAIVPSGKTNALALDLGLRPDWTLDDAIDAVVTGRRIDRAPIVIRRDGDDRAERAGFIFGSGAFVRATRLAQRTHRFGAFNGLAVGLSVAAGIGQTILAGKDNPWRRGEMMRVEAAGDAPVEGLHYMLLASTLRRMPLGIKPFGAPRAGLKMLRIEGPVRATIPAVLPVLGGADPAWLAGAGYHRRDAHRIDLALEGGFVLDGETFEGGDLSLHQGAPISFIVP